MKVISSGGLGNQLFQFTFAQYLQKREQRQVELMLFRRKNDVPHTHIHIDSVIESSRDVIIRKVSNQIISKATDPIAQARFQFCLSDSRDEPFITPVDLFKENRRYSKYLGYFQNKDFLLEVEREVLLALEPVMSRARRFREQYGEYEVTHIRGGDTLTKYNRNRVGVLSPSYYSSAKISSNALYKIVITDDINWAVKVLNKVNVDTFLGPDSLDAIDCLSLMSASKRLIAANSTFSWWGAVLALQQGAEVLFPDPIFRSESLHSGTAFHFPGFYLNIAQFVD